MIPPNSTLCGLEEVDTEPMQEIPNTADQSQVENIDLTTTEKNLTTEQMNEFKTQLHKWENLLAKDALDL